MGSHRSSSIWRGRKSTTGRPKGLQTRSARRARGWWPPPRCTLPCGRGRPRPGSSRRSHWEGGTRPWFCETKPNPVAGSLVRQLTQNLIEDDYVPVAGRGCPL